MMAIFRNGSRVLLMISFLAGVASGRQPVQLKPLWRVDLRKLGFAYPSDLQFSLTAYARHTIVNFSGKSIAVTHKGYIAFAFLTTEIEGKASDPSKLTRQHLISLDAATGHIVANHTWPAEDADSGNAYVGATAEGNFVLLKRDSTGEALCLLSPDLQVGRRTNLPADPATSTSDWSIFVPPSGVSIFLEHYLNGKLSLQMLDATSLRENGAWTKSEDIRQFSGQYLWRLQGDPEEGVRLYTRTFASPWRATAQLGHCTDKQVEFSNEDTAVVNCGDSAMMIQANGRVLFTVRAPKRRSVGSAWGSPDGRFVAVATTTKHGLAIAEAFDMSSGSAPRRLLVYDTKTGNVVDSLKLTWGYELTFLADNSGFVLLSGGILEMFKLPKMVR
jgi:hypothetical protein